MNSIEIRNKATYRRYIMPIIVIQTVEIAGCMYNKVVKINFKLL